jgi:ribosomal protein S6
MLVTFHVYPLGIWMRAVAYFRRYIENYGVRPLAYPVRKGGQKFEEVRWVHAFYDVSPTVLASVASAIQSEKSVLQYKHLRHEDELAAFKQSGKTEKLKRFSSAMRFNTELFDPNSLGAPEAGQELR